MLLERRKIAMIMAEFLGTAILTAVVLAVSRSNLGVPYFIGLGAGLTIAAGTLIFGVASGAHFNPIITLGLWTARQVKTLPALVYIAAQILGGLAAYLLYTYLTNANWSNAPSNYDTRVLVAEAAGAFVFAMGWAAAVFHRLEAGKAAFVVGASLALGVLIASVGSAGLLNPAVALGVRSWDWGTYVLGPVLGGIIAFNLYALLFAPTSSLVRAKAAAVDKPVAAKSASKKKK